MQGLDLLVLCLVCLPALVFLSPAKPSEEDRELPWMELVAAIN